MSRGKKINTLTGKRIASNSLGQLSVIEHEWEVDHSNNKNLIVKFHTRSAGERFFIKIKKAPKTTPYAFALNHEYQLNLEQVEKLIHAINNPESASFLLWQEGLYITCADESCIGVSKGEAGQPVFQWSQPQLNSNNVLYDWVNLDVVRDQILSALTEACK